MNQTYEPSPHFVTKVMAQVRQFEAQKLSFLELLITSRPLRYVLAGGSTIFGILKAAPVF